eukprot:1031079_1
MGQFLGVHKLKAYVKRNVKKKLQKNIPPPHESQPLIVDEPNDQISYEHNGSDHIYEFTDDEEQKKNETNGFQIQSFPNASTPMDTTHTHDDVTPFVNVMPIATKMAISENEMNQMMCGADTIDAMFALGRISNKPMDLTEVFTTDDELQNDSDSSANPPDSDRGDGDDDEIVEEYGNRKINWDTTKSSSNPTARVFEHESRHRYAFGTAIIDTDDLEGDETKGAINDTKQISECVTPITSKDVVQCNEQTIHEGCVNCDGIHGIDCIAKALISRNKKQDGEPGTDANTDSVPTVLPLDLTPQPETHILDTEQNLNISDVLIRAAIQTEARIVTTGTDQQCDLANCQHMQRLCVALRSYHAKQTNDCHPIFNDNSTIVSALDDFHHLLFHHDQQFQYIHDKLMEECLSQDTCSLDECSIAHDHHSEASVCSYVDRRETVEHEILDKIHCYYLHSFDSGYRLRSSDRQKPLESEQKGDKIECDAMHARTRYSSISEFEPKVESSSNTKEMYILGASLQYGYENEIVRPGAIRVQPRFMSLKDELTSNNICTLSIGQFNCEFESAQIHFNTHYRKKRCPLLLLEQILALMIWCNYDQLQYKFSHTFREFEGMNHVDYEFYHFGMTLKRAVYEHGTRIMDGHIDKFYRGLDKSLVFSETAIHINGPFSTTTSFGVAANFSHGFNGVVVELRDEFGFNKYFPVHWLSNFSFEKECLFMDNQYPLVVFNILALGTNSEYTVLLYSISLFEKLITHQPIATQDMCKYSHTMEVMAEICKYMVSKTPPRYFDQYSEHLIESFCENQTQIIIDHDWKRTYPFMFHLSFKSVDGCTTLNIDALCDVFPNIECITALHAPLSTLLVHDIYTTLKTHPLEYVQLQSMRTTTQMALAHYPALFKQINYSIDVHDNRLCFYRADCDVPPPCRMDQPCYKDEVYNQCSQYLDSNPHASEFVRSVYEHRKGHQMNFADDTVQVKTLISHFLAYQEHLNRLRASLQSYCGDDHPLMPLLCRDIMQTLTPNYYLEDKIETPTLKSAITLSECMIEPIVIPADTHMQTLAAAAKTIISENEMICNANTEDEMFAYLKEAIELKRNRDLSDMISNAKYSTDTEDVYTDHELETDCNDSQFDSISLDESYVPGLVSCTPCAFSEEPHKHGVVTCPGTNDNNPSTPPQESTADDSKQNPPDDLPEESTNNENNDNQQNAKKRGDGGDDGDKKKNTGDGVPGDNDEEEEEEEDDEDEEDEDKEDEKNEIAKEQQNPKKK